MIGGTPNNTTSFVSGQYLGGDQNSAEKEKMRHDLTVEKYQAAYEKYQENRAKLLDWIATPESKQICP